MHRREAASWHHMTLHYGLVDAWRLDSFHKMSKKDFTFNNGRSGTRSAVSRIDKFLVSQEGEERGGKIEAAASVRKLTDHLLLVITVWGHHPPQQPLTIFRRLSADGREEQERTIGSLDRRPTALDQRPRVARLAGRSNRKSDEVQRVPCEGEETSSGSERQGLHDENQAGGDTASE